MIHVGEQMMCNMVIKAPHEEAREPVIMCNVVGGKQHVHHPAMVKAVVRVREGET